MAFELLSDRLLVLPDNGSDTTGVIIAHDTVGRYYLSCYAP